MSITFACETCGESFTVEDRFGGKEGKCERCGAVVPIPESDAVALPVGGISSSRRPLPTAQRPPRAASLGLEGYPIPARQAPPAGIEEVDRVLPAAAPSRAHTRGLLGPPTAKAKGSEIGFANSIVKIALAVLFGLVGLGGVSYGLRSLSRSFMAGATSRAKFEAILQERVRLNQELATILAGVVDVPSAQAASPLASQKIKEITANLRSLNGSTGSKNDLDSLKRLYKGPQERASSRAYRQTFRIAEIPGVWEALNVRDSFAELEKEEKVLPGQVSVEIPHPVVPIIPASKLDQDKPPGLKSGP